MKALLLLLFAVGVDIIRAIVLAFMLNALVLPAFGLAPITVLTAFALGMALRFMSTPSDELARDFLKSTLYSPPDEDHLKSSELQRHARMYVGFLIQAALVAALVYFLA